MTRQPGARGFILVATIMLSLAISIVAATAAQYIVSSSQTLSMQTYRSIAQEAAYSGISYGLSCIAAASTGWTTLAPNTGCSGTPEDGVSSILIQSATGEWQATFTVNSYDVSRDAKVTATGTVSLAAGVKISMTKSVAITTALKQVPVPQATDKAITDIGADTHSCAIANGQLYCWGLNSSGQLGDGSTTNRSTPMLVAATNPGDTFYGKMITQVAVGTGNTCAVADGQLYCWGDNTYGQLGIGTAGSYRALPQAVLNPGGLSDFKVTSLSISKSSPGSKSVCAIANGIVYCWGANDKGQLGQYSGPWWSVTSDTTARTVPTPVWGYRTPEVNGSYAPLLGQKSTSVSVGTTKGCSIAQGTMNCWGDSGTVTSYASAGDYTWNIPAQPWSAEVFNQGYCSVNDTLICTGWGVFDNNNANYTFTGSPARLNTLPISIHGATNYDGADYLSGDGLICAVIAGFPVCRGSNMYTGINNVFSRIPLAASYIQLRSSTKVAVGQRYACIIANGGLACWGSVSQGQMADGNYSSSSTIPQYTGYPTIGVDSSAAGSYFVFTAPGPISAGKNFRCTGANGVPFCWGANDKGQLGINNTAAQGQPTLIDLSSVIHWTLPDGTTAPFTPPERITSGGDHSCMITTNFTNLSLGPALLCWGSNTYGELGTNDTTSKSSPVAVKNTWSDGAIVTEVSAGPRNTCAIADSQLYCWGDKSNGMLGDGSTSGLQKTPQLVTAFAGKQVTTVSVGTNHVCAIVNGDGYCWGSNANYATAQTVAGIAINTGITTPVYGGTGLVKTGTAATTYGNLATGTFTGITAGSGFSCAIINGTTSCWGKNDMGQTGTNSPSDVKQPTLLSNGAGGNLTLQASVVSAGTSHACAVLQARIYCWGDNTGGKLGDGTQTQRPTPVLINGGAVGNRATISIAAGDDGTCSVSNGAVLCWGGGLSGQVGDNGWANRLVPAVISGYRMAGACGNFSCKGPVY